MTWVTLTNASNGSEGESIALDVSKALSIYSKPVKKTLGTDDNIEHVTYIYFPPHGEWQVKESIEEILNQLK